MRLLLVILVLLGALPRAHAQGRIPQKTPRQWVVDDAKLLARHETADIEKHVAAVHRELDVQVVVVTLATLGSESAKIFATRVEPIWRPGKRWVLLLLVGGKEAFIEPSDDLRAVLRPAPVQQVCFQKVAPKLVMKDTRGALRAGIDGIAQLVRAHAPEPEKKPVALGDTLPPEPLAPVASAAARTEAARAEDGATTKTAIATAVAVAVVVIAIAFLRARSGQTRAGA